MSLALSSSGSPAAVWRALESELRMFLLVLQTQNCWGGDGDSVQEHRGADGCFQLFKKVLLCTPHPGSCCYHNISSSFMPSCYLYDMKGRETCLGKSSKTRPPRIPPATDLFFLSKSSHCLFLWEHCVKNFLFLFQY